MPGRLPSQAVVSLRIRPEQLMRLDFHQLDCSLVGRYHLPAPYTKDIRVEKLARGYAHVYDHYFGAGQSAYQSARVV
jgi:hypothetical protein